MKSWHVRKMQRRNQQRESRRKLSEEAFLWKDFLFRALRFLQKKATWLLVCWRAVCLHTCAYSELPQQEGSLYFGDIYRGRAVCPQRLYLFLTGRLVHLAAAGWHGKGTNLKKPLHPASTQPCEFNLCPNFPKCKACPGHTQELQWS